MTGGKFPQAVYALLAACLLLIAHAGIDAHAEARVSAAAQHYDKGLLWKIEGGDAEPSYLFGTIHSDDPRVTRLPAPVRQSFNQSNSFTMEMLTDGDGIVAMARAMFFDDGKTLVETIGEELYDKTERALHERGLPADDLERKKPWAIVLMLVMPRQVSGMPLDFLLQFEAVRQGKAVYGLETIDEQIAIFNDTPLPEQVGLLKEALRHYRETDSMLEKMIVAYLERDLSGLYRLAQQFQPEEDEAAEAAYERFMHRLLTRRNVIMAERMQARLKEGNAFIAIGAAHLPGEQGVLRLLELKGYRVTPVY